jgi:hypothetical protein
VFEKPNRSSFTFYIYSIAEAGGTNLSCEGARANQVPSPQMQLERGPQLTLLVQVLDRRRLQRHLAEGLQQARSGHPQR